MDFKIENRDVLTDSTGKLVPVTGEDELLQRAYICIAVKKGSFIYDRELGSEIYGLDKDDEHFKEKLNLVMNEALINCGGVKAEVSEIKGSDIGIKLTCGEKTLERVITL